MNQSITNTFKYSSVKLIIITQHVICGCLLALLLIFQTNVFAQKNNSKNVPSTSLSEDEKKFDLLKVGNETVWTCENNVKVKTAQSGNNYLFLFNRKLFTMTGIEALNGVSRFSDIVHRYDWFIIPGKAMLFDSKAGQRLLDYCKHAELPVVDNSKAVDLMK
jgi:hypothetical protein